MVQEGGTYRSELWPNPATGDVVDAEGWLVNLHVAREREHRAHPCEYVHPVFVLILGNPTMEQLWSTTNLRPTDGVEVEPLAPARVRRALGTLPSWYTAPDALAPAPVLVKVEVLTAESIQRLGRPELDDRTVLGQPRHRFVTRAA